MMRSIAASQLSTEDASSWTWDVAVEHEGEVRQNDDGPFGYVATEKWNEEFFSINTLLSPGRYFLCAALESLGDHESTQTEDESDEIRETQSSRRLIPVAYFDVWGWFPSHYTEADERVTSIAYTLRGWFPVTQPVAQFVDGAALPHPLAMPSGDGATVDSLSLRWNVSGNVTTDRSAYTQQNVTARLFACQAAVDGSPPLLQLSVAIDTESAVDSTRARQNPSLGCVTAFQSSLIVQLPPNSEYVVVDDGAQMHGPGDPIAVPSIEAKGAVDAARLDGINATLRIVPLDSFSRTQRLFYVDDLAVAGDNRSTWGIDIALIRVASHTSSVLEYVPLQGCTVPGSPLGPTPCSFGSAQEEQVTHVVCELTVRQLAGLLAPSVAPAEHRGVQFHCLPTGPPYLPIIVEHTPVHDVELRHHRDAELEKPSALGFISARRHGTQSSTVCFEQLQAPEACHALLSVLSLPQHHRLTDTRVLAAGAVAQLTTIYFSEALTLRSRGGIGAPLATAVLAGNVRPRLPGRVRHAELLLSYIIESRSSSVADKVRGYLMSASSADVLRTFALSTDDRSATSPSWNAWCSGTGAQLGNRWHARLMIDERSGDADPSAFDGVRSWDVTGTPAIIPAPVLQDVSRCSHKDLSHCVQLFAVFCRPHHSDEVDSHGGDVLMVPVLLLKSFDVSPMSISVRMECPHSSVRWMLGGQSCVNILPKVKLVRQPLRNGFPGTTSTVAADEIGAYYCREPSKAIASNGGHDDAPITRPRRKNGEVLMEVMDAWATANLISGSSGSNASLANDEVPLRPPPTLYRSLDGGTPTLFLRADRPQVEAAASSSGAKQSSQRGEPLRYGPFALCASVDVTAAFETGREHPATPLDDHLIEDVFVGFAVFVPPPMLQAVAVPPPSPLGIDALSESWWAFVATNLDAVHAALTSIPGGARSPSTSAQGGPHDTAVTQSLVATQWLRYPLRLVPFSRSISGRDYMRKHKPHRNCFATLSSVSSEHQAPGTGVRHAMPLAAHDAKAIASAARDMYRTSRMDGSAVWLLRARGAFYGDFAVCASIDGVDEFVGLLNVPGPWYTAPALPAPVLASLSSQSPANRQTFSVTAGSPIRLAFSVVAHSGAENLRSGLQLLRREEMRWAAMIGTEEPQVDGSQVVEENLVIDTPLHYEEVTRPSVSQDIDRVVTAVLTAMVPGVYLVCFAKGLAWDNTSKLASGQQRSPEGLALSAAVRRSLESSAAWIRQFDKDDLPPNCAEHDDRHSNHSWWNPLGALHQSVGMAPVLGINRTASVRLPTLTDVNVWTILQVRTPTIDPKKWIHLEMNGPRVVMTIASSAVRVVATRLTLMVGWATACVESEYSATIRSSKGSSDQAGGEDFGLDSLGHRPGVALARTVTSPVDGSVVVSFLLTPKNLCGKRSVQLLAGWRRVARAVRTPHRNRFVAHDALDDSNVDAHRVVWRTVAAAVELPGHMVDVIYQRTTSSDEGANAAQPEAPTSDGIQRQNRDIGTPHEAHLDGLQSQQHDSSPSIGLDASPPALDLDGIEDL
jgi:hypothetical protein